jgi:rhodanese-related sulfurtransferase
MQNYLIVLLLLMFHSTFSQTKIGNTKFKELMVKENTVILDVRTPEEFAEGHIKGAINVNYFSSEFLSKVKDKIGKSKRVLVYCAAGGRSQQACKELKKAGYKKLYDLSTGYDGWE